MLRMSGAKAFHVLINHGRRADKFAEARVLAPYEAPDQPENDQSEDGVARIDVPGIFFLAGQISDNKTHDQRPVKDANQNVPDWHSGLIVHNNYLQINY